ncbi:hypothetical protein [Salinicola avicenniae]|uniref:hypothetical protein n=1 Tax=Salinicola avicenniae TaxID=2916836 RepID=UPI00207479C2|nr:MULTISPECIES: hypothetical protein [unclassified Salinicola]
MSRITYRPIAYALTDARLQMVQLAGQMQAEGDTEGAQVLLTEQRRLAAFVHEMDGRILAAMSPLEGKSE